MIFVVVEGSVEEIFDLGGVVYDYELDELDILKELLFCYVMI